jgi:hypothetical protein
MHSREASAQEPRRPGADLFPHLRENLIIGGCIVVYAALMLWPLYNLVAGVGSQPANFTLFGGMVGLMLAGYATMTERVHGPLRWAIGAIGLSFLVFCWGFGPL